MEITEDLKKVHTLSISDYEKTIEFVCKNQKRNFDWVLFLHGIEDKSVDDAVRALFRLLNYIAETIIDSRSYEDGLTELDQLICNISQNDEDAKSGWLRLKQSLPKLDTFLLYKKEVEIKDRFERISKFEITTDIRPIFSLDKTEIIKKLVVNILKIGTINDKSFVCEFYDDDIDDLINELQRTKNKINLIKSHE